MRAHEAMTRDVIAAGPSTAVREIAVNGVVELWGASVSDKQRRTLRIPVQGVGGVQRVEDNVGLLPIVVSA
jgi:hypothetical protein